MSHQIDLDDLPPKMANRLRALGPGEELLLVQGGVVVGRLIGGQVITAALSEDARDEGGMQEILETFNAMIHDEF